MEKLITIKENDVYSFRYNPEVAAKRYSPYHCFDGQLVVKLRGTQLILEDTYWGYVENRAFTLEQALQEGTLTFKCNLNEVHDISEYDCKYYNNDDIFNLSHQHGCYKRYVLRNGAERDYNKMIQVLNERLAEAQSEVDYAQSNIRNIQETLEKIKTEDINSIYI